MSWERLKDKNLQKRLVQRAKIISLAREFFMVNGFLQVETPILVRTAGQEPYLNPMKVILTAGSGQATSRRGLATKSRDGYLITSPEYAHKKLLAAGFIKTFEITKCFRGGEPSGGLHNPEFTMLEWYRACATYYTIMNDVEKMAQYVMRGIKETRKQGNKETFVCQGRTIDLSSPWERITMVEAWQKYVPGFRASFFCDRKKMMYFAKRLGYGVSRRDTYEDIFFKIFLTRIEPKLGFSKPTILYEYPPQLASLARIVTKRRAPRLLVTEVIAERFELYIAGIEIANAFSELNNEPEQRQRFLQEQKLRKKLGKEIIPLDEDFLNAVGNMPPSAGIALGIDRLVMLLTNAKTIEQVLAFPAKESLALK